MPTATVLQYVFHVPCHVIQHSLPCIQQLSNVRLRTRGTCRSVNTQRCEVTTGRTSSLPRRGAPCDALQHLPASSWVAGPETLPARCRPSRFSGPGEAGPARCKFPKQRCLQLTASPAGAHNVLCFGGCSALTCVCEGLPARRGLPVTPIRRRSDPHSSCLPVGSSSWPDDPPGHVNKQQTIHDYGFAG